MKTTQAVPSVGYLLTTALLGSLGIEERKRILLRDAPPMRPGEYAFPASSPLEFVMTTRLIAPKRVHWPRVVATVWRKSEAGSGPVRLASITWCHEWIASACLFKDFPAGFDTDAQCDACVAGYRAEAKARA
jgi:hypothetical protein